MLAVLTQACAGPRAAEIGAAYREMMGADSAVPWPAVTAVQVNALIDDRAKVEIEATAVIPDPA